MSLSAKPIAPQILYERMALIRSFEETLLRLFSEGKLFGTTHTCIGQEAIAVAVGAHLSEDDVIFSSHRCHGHFIACGGPPELLLAEIMGKETGVCRGRGGSQHLHFRRFFSSGIQGGIVGNAVGAALAEKLFNRDAIVVVFLGDGTLGQGLVYESLNFAALKKLPVLFVLEDNGYAQTTPIRLGVAGDMKARPEAFGIPAHEIESNDVVEISAIFKERIDQVRARRAPFFQIVHTYRLSPHSKGDDFRERAEIEQWRQKDPLLIVGKTFDENERAALAAKAGAVVDDAVAFAEASPESDHAFVMSNETVSESFPTPFPRTQDLFVKNLNAALRDILEQEQNAFVMGEDLLDPYGGAFGVMRGLSTRFPDRVIPTPISEAGIVAWGIGAALMGARPIVEIMFGDFLALAADQLLNHAPKYEWVSDGRVHMPLVVRTPMGGGRGYGPTHSQSLEKMFMGIPGLAVVAPSNLLEPGELLKRAVATDYPVLFIEHKLLYPKPLATIADGRMSDFFVRATDSRFPTVHLSLADFETPDVTLVSYGGSVPLAKEAAVRLMYQEDIVADIVIPSILSPLPLAEITRMVGGCLLVATIEEGQKPCGWGGEIVAAITEAMPVAGRRFLRFAAASSPIPAAGTLERQALPNFEGIFNTIRRTLR